MTLADEMRGLSRVAPEGNRYGDMVDRQFEWAKKIIRSEAERHGHMVWVPSYFAFPQASRDEKILARVKLMLEEDGFEVEEIKVYNKEVLQDVTLQVSW